MNELLKTIFDNIIIHEIEVIKTNKNLNSKVQELIQPYEKQFEENELEIIKNLMYSIMLFSEQEGFQLGTKYTIKIFLKFLLDL